MTAVTQKAIDLALATRYDSVQIDVDGTPTDVSVFIEQPSTEEFPERVFPSVSIQFLTMVYDEKRAHSDDGSLEETAYNDGVDPPVRTSRQNGVPFVLGYSIDTWHKNRADEDRDLISEILVQRTAPQGYMPVTNIDSGTENVWVMWSGGLVALDETDGDYVVYHKSLTVHVYADLLTDTSTYDDKVVTQLLMKFYARDYIYNRFGESEVSDDNLVEDVQIRVTDIDEGPYSG